ncbi:unnamed protein product [Dovyalis caffra]|uniref:Uncharacterized protein n=1 Tax=Dovyalis caffra TaxID=77055 RepID=A0AAV1R644_9ROSI|nr:unnamed protein product [Dovyalis caffra]
MLPDSDVFKNELKSLKSNSSLGENKDADDNDHVEKGLVQGPRQADVYQQLDEEDEPSEVEAPIPLEDQQELESQIPNMRMPL